MNSHDKVQKVGCRWRWPSGTQQGRNDFTAWRLCTTEMQMLRYW